MLLRTAALRLPINRASATVGRRMASAAAADPLTGLQPADIQEVGIHNFKDPRIPAGTIAYQWDVPKVLPETGFLKRRQAVAAHAEQTTDLWRKISFYICLPAIVVTAIWVYKLEVAHEEHHQHLVEANGGEEPERKVYSYMNLKTKPYPWGNQSLFFNPKVNIPVE